MTLVLRELYKQYKYLTTEVRDKRLEDFFLMGSPIQILAISFLYCCFVNKWGPKIMKNRKAFELKAIMIVYNLTQIVANLAIVMMGTPLLIEELKNYRCILVDYSTTPRAMLIAKLTYAYYLLKVFDLLDTVFIVLRKRYKQVTFLHVYHHCGMVILTYAGANYMPGGHGGVLGIVNSFVHTIMYFYYFLTCMDPMSKASMTGWKKQLTRLQMIQFSILIIHFGHPLLFGNCQYPKIGMFVMVTQNLFMLSLFSDFYYRTYYKKSSKIN